MLKCFFSLLFYTGALSFAVVGYFPEWRYRLFDEDHADRLEGVCNSLTHLLIFSLEVSPMGELAAMDRWPSPDRLERVKRLCPDTAIMVCFGGNSRSNGFSDVVRSETLRNKFVDILVAFMHEHELAGVDWNWEYPKDDADWRGLKKLMERTREKAPKALQTMAYYPDTQQEHILHTKKFYDVLDYMHMMAYDQPKEHSTWQFAVDGVRKAAKLPQKKVTLGLPFYSRDVKMGEWKTYHDIEIEYQTKHGKSLPPSVDRVGDHYFNGIDMIKKKTKLAMERGLGGVMIWESGQDTKNVDLHKAITSAINDYEPHQEL